MISETNAKNSKTRPDLHHNEGYGPMVQNKKTSTRKDKQNEFAVIGLGRFGGSLARRLESLGHIVLGIDQDMARVQEISDEITSAVTLNAANEDALEEVDIVSFGTVIVGIGDNFEDAALITAYLKTRGIPRVITLAQTSRHRNLLLRVGADQVILSDEDSGLRLAEALATPNMMERAVLDTNHSLTELKVPVSLVGQPVKVLGQYGITVLLIQRPDRLLPSPEVETKMEQGDTLFTIGPREKLLEVASLP
jgi:trk system potassium uptake protein TrkA